uniref:SH2 domain-containing protein n=1 Tax=Romanomermis culicivorax TaxID=13658 RepID=A0A915HNX2_ROMCU
MPLRKSPTSAGCKFRLSDYYHGELRHEYLLDLLMKNGDFLIRQSTQSSNVLSVLWDRKVRNFQPDYDGVTYRMMVAVIMLKKMQYTLKN